MKNINKHYTGSFCALCFIFCSALSLLLLAACSSPDMDMAQKGGIRINVSDNIGRATLLPSANFTKIILSFVNTSGSATYQDINLEPHHTYITINDLPNGSWKITATGYIKISDDEYPAASGEQTITVTGSSFHTVNITMKARHDGDNGFISYDINFPSIVTDAKLYIFNIEASYNDHHGVTERDLKSAKQGLISHAPGFYMMSVRMTTPYRTVAWTEVVHIYSNMETKAVKVFTEDDLTKLVTAGGNANITINGMPPHNANIYFYRDSGYSDSFYSTFIHDGKWSIAIPALAQATTLYVKVYINFAGKTYEYEPVDTITLHTGHVDYSDITYHIEDDLINISGTANFTINAIVPDAVDVSVKKWNEDWNDWEYDSENTIYIDNNIYSLYFDKELLNERIQILLWNNLEIDEIELNSTTITRNIDFHVTDKVVLRGDVDFKVCGAYPFDFEIQIRDYWDQVLSWGNFEPSGTWELEILFAPVFEEDVYIWIWTEETNLYYTKIDVKVAAVVCDVPTEAIYKDINIIIDVPQTTSSGIITAFDTYYDLYLNLMSTEVTKGTPLNAEILNYRNYLQEHEITCTWFINGVRQDVTTSVSSSQYSPFVGTVSLPTASLTPGKQYGLVVVTIDGAAFAQEFSFLVNE